MADNNGTLDPTQVHYVNQYSVEPVRQFSSILNSATQVYYTRFDEALRNSRENARMMRRTPVIMEPLLARYMAVTESPWHLEPEDAHDKQQQSVCKDLTRLINDTPNFLQLMVWLEEAMWFGKSGVQLRYAQRVRRGKKEYYIANWSPTHGDSIVFKYPDDAVGILLASTPSYKGATNIDWQLTDVAAAHILTPTERQNWIIHTGLKQAGDFFEAESAGWARHGVGLRQFVYWYFYLMQEAIQWAMEFIERVALGIMIWYYEFGNTPSLQAVEKAARNQDFRNILLVPRPIGQEKQGSGVERIDPNPAGLQTMLGFIKDFFGEYIQRLIVGQTLTSQAESTGLGSSVATQHANTFARIVAFDAANLSSTLSTDLIPVLMRWNFPEADFSVKFKLNTDRPEKDKLLDAVAKAAALDIPFDKDEVRSLLGLSKPDDNSEVTSVTGALTKAGELRTPGEPARNKKPRKQKGDNAT